MIIFLQKYLRHRSIPIAWSVIILILLTLPGSMLPSEAPFRIAHFDKLVHTGLFGGFVFLWATYCSTRNYSHRKLLGIFFFLFIISCTYGTAMEFVQKYFIPSRDFELGDIVADIIGSAIAYLSCIMMF
jgi:VanZ family protein